jgi:hypothetical protein
MGLVKMGKSHSRVFILHDLASRQKLVNLPQSCISSFYFNAKFHNLALLNWLI